MREFLKGLELDKETIDKIMAEYGKGIQSMKDEIEELKDNETMYKEKEKTFKARIEELSNKSNDSQKIQEELETLKKEIAEREAKEKADSEEETLNKNILTIFGDKKFTSEYAKAGLMNDIKTELKKDENKGLGIQEIFNRLTKDKEDIFANPNQLKDMEGMGDTDTSVSKEAFEKMSYNERVEFKQSNPELFEKYNQ